MSQGQLTKGEGEADTRTAAEPEGQEGEWSTYWAAKAGVEGWATWDLWTFSSSEWSGGLFCK